MMGILEMPKHLCPPVFNGVGHVAPPPPPLPLHWSQHTMINTIIAKQRWMTTETQ